MADKNLEKFVEELSRSLQTKTFVKATLGNYKGDDPHLQKVVLRLIQTRRGNRVQLVFRYANRDTAKNFELVEAVRMIRSRLGREYRAAHLFSLEGDLQLTIGKRGKCLLTRSAPTFRQAPGLAHDRKKDRPLDQNSEYLKILGITDKNGRVKDKQRAKWRQINHFVANLDGLVAEAGLDQSRGFDVADLGSGKGYLTFALYDHLRNNKQLNARVTGIEARQDLAEFCEGAAKDCGFLDLRFIRGRIGETEIGNADVLIALHACDTATDDAIYQGIRSRAKLIVVAPCCHQEIRAQLSLRPPFKELFGHGVLLEAEAESITDGIRAMLLKQCGYSVKIFDFVSVEHTPKNKMIAGTINTRSDADAAATSALSEIKEFYGITHQRLEDRLCGQIDTEIS